MKSRKTRARGSRRFLRSITLANLLLAVFAAVPTGVLAQGGHASESAQAAQVRALNNSVLQLHGQMQENASGAAWIRGQAAAVIAQRAAALTALIEKDPHA